MNPPEDPGAGSGADSKDLGRKFRRRSPRYLVGLRRLALVVAAAAWGYSFYAASSQPAGSFLDQHAVAFGLTLALAIAYWMVAIVANNSRGVFKNAFRSLKSAVLGSGRSKWERTTRQLSWIAVVVSVWFVYDVINQHETYSTKEVLVVMAIAATSSYVAVRLISWVLRGFVRVK